MPQYTYPTGDILDGGWTNESGTQSNLYESVNEPTTPNDLDYIVSSVNPVDDTVRLAMSGFINPDVGTVTIRVRGRRGVTMVPFHWAAEPGATSYILQVGITPGGYGVFNENVGYVRTYTLYLTRGTYYSRVVPVGAGSPTAEQTVVVA